MAIKIAEWFRKTDDVYRTVVGIGQPLGKGTPSRRIKEEKPRIPGAALKEDCSLASLQDEDRGLNSWLPLLEGKTQGISEKELS